VKGLVVETGEAAPATREIDVEVVHRSDGTTEERPFVPLPILFVVGTDNLLDDTSRTNSEKMAGILKDLIERENARFTIQGHTSADGDAGANQTLSERRAERILATLVARGVPSASMDRLGLGEDCARVADTAAEAQLQQDRRVLIVRMK
jgi:outer membrane protein OmpA-like peptidoglycan-associated protein